MSEIFVTSDTHYFHDNIIRFSNRPFETVEEMNEAMIERWNARVQKGDLVYHLGDFALKCKAEDAGRIVERLNGQIILIRGNHDSIADQIKGRFAAIKDYDEIKVTTPLRPKGVRLLGRVPDPAL